MGENQTAPADPKQTASSVTASNGQEVSTSQQPQTFTEEQVSKRVSDALAKAGREAKTFEATRADIAAREAKLAEFEAKREEAEFDGIDATPQQKLELKAYKDRLRAEKQAYLKELEDFKKEKAEWEGQINEAKTTRFESSVTSIADKHNVSAEALKAKAAKLGITDLEAINELAEVMPKKAVVATPDSGKTTGGSITANMSPRELIAAGLNKK